MKGICRRRPWDTPVCLLIPEICSERMFLCSSQLLGKCRRSSARPEQCWLL
jgi:hypothetical protein